MTWKACMQPHVLAHRFFKIPSIDLESYVDEETSEDLMKLSAALLCSTGSPRGASCHLLAPFKSRFTIKSALTVSLCRTMKWGMDQSNAVMNLTATYYIKN